MNLCLSRTFLDPGGANPECEPGFCTLVSIFIFHSMGPKVVGPSHWLKIHPNAVFLLWTALALLYPLRFQRQADGLQLLDMGPFAVECHLD